MRALLVPPATTSIPDALARSGSTLKIARAERSVVATVTRLDDERPTIVLGALQRAGRVIERIERVVRRTTTGTGITLRGGMIITLALPWLDAIFGDATPATILNRNVRPIMKGLANAGVPVQYFGREWLAWKRRAIFVLGMDVEPDGAVLIEAFATAAGSLAIPPDASTALEASVDRYRGLAPASLREAGVEPTTELSIRVLEGMTERMGLMTQRFTTSTIPIDPRRAPTVVDHPMSPLPRDATLLEPMAIPIGFLDVAVLASGSWVGGDILAPRHLMGRNGPGADDEASPMEGALWRDVRRAHQTAYHQSRCGPT